MLAAAHEGSNYLLSLQTFLDASQDAYGAVVYGITVYESELSSSVLAAAKTRVAPLSAMSVSRL